MSVNASEHELTQLIYRHLKEHGFHSAADELQRHSPQGELKTSASLLEIYSSWLNDSKKKRQPISKEQGGTPAKAAAKKKNKPANKAETQKKKTVPAKRKKSEGKPVIKAKKSKSQTEDKAVTAGGDDSDSDSSLDVEKWKKLVLQMTESDISKMEIINSLDSSAPPPVKKRVRKPRAKPPVTDTPVQQNSGTAGKNEKVEEKEVTDIKSSTPKRSRLKKSAPVTSSTTLSQEPNTSAGEDRPAVSTLSPSKHTVKKEKKEAVTPSEVKTDETMSEPKKKTKKKKEKEMTETNVEEDTEICGDGKHKDSKEEKQTEVTEQEFDVRPVEKKKAKGTGDGKLNKTEGEILEKSIHGGVDSEESIVQEKKAKKKKKDKTDSEENLVQVAEKVKENSEQTTGDSEEISEQKSGGEEDKGTAEEKQTKKKRKDKTVSEENPEQIAEEKQEKKKRKDKTVSEENPEQIVKEKKKKKKHKADPDEATFEQVVEENTTMTRKSESSDREDKPEQITEVKKKKKKKLSSLENNDTEPLPPATSSPAKEMKKKKSKLKSMDVPETPGVSVQDVAAVETLQTPNDTPHKKKKKSSKNTES